VTLGSRLEHDTIAAWGVAPTARVMWDIGPYRQRVWAAISRARRTPSVSDLNVRVNYSTFPGPQGVPVVLGLIGNPAFASEKVISADVGYRLPIGLRASLDVSAFRARYDDLQTSEPLTPVFEQTPAPPHLFIPTQYGNLLQVDTTGIEIASHWNPNTRWQLTASMSALHLVPHRHPTSQDLAKDRFDGNAPTHQAQLRSTIMVGTRSEITAALFHVGALRELEVPAYTRADVRLEHRLTTQLSIVAGGQNLFDRAHAEQLGRSGLTVTLVPRSASINLVWRHRP
jgi:iron complex outermembrane receptor protein